MDLLVKNGTVVTATDTFQADIGVENGQVVQIVRPGTLSTAVRVIDASGKYVLPGGVDVHTHLDAPSMGTVSADDFLTGTIAAACGGTTTIVDFCSQERGQSLAEALATWHAKAEGKAVIDYGFHIVIVDMTDSVYEELATCPAQGVTSFKLFMAYKGRQMIDDWTLVRALDQARKHGALVMVHAENGDAAFLLQQRLLAEGKTAPKYHATSRPPRVEAEATARAIALAEVVGAPIFIVHVSCSEAIDEIVRGRSRGVAVYAETCPQYLYLTEDKLDQPGFEGGKYVFTPPPRAAHQPARVWQSLATGELQSVSSDHCPFNFRGQKELGLNDFTKIPNGAPGIEERLMLVYQGVNRGLLSLNRFVDLVATTPAKTFGLFPQKGTIAIGSDADLVIWDPTAEFTLSTSTLHQNVDYTMYEGLKVRGIPDTVTLRGEVIVERRQFVGKVGGGRYLRRKRFGE